MLKDQDGVTIVWFGNMSWSAVSLAARMSAVLVLAIPWMEVIVSITSLSRLRGTYLSGVADYSQDDGEERSSHDEIAGWFELSFVEEGAIS